MQLEALMVPSEDDTAEDTETGSAAPQEAKKRGGAGWVLGAYAVLVIWGGIYLFLFFADRLPG